MQTLKKTCLLCSRRGTIRLGIWWSARNGIFDRGHGFGKASRSYKAENTAGITHSVERDNSRADTTVRGLVATAGQKERYKVMPRGEGRTVRTEPPASGSSVCDRRPRARESEHTAGAVFGERVAGGFPTLVTSDHKFKNPKELPAELKTENPSLDTSL